MCFAPQYLVAINTIKSLSRRCSRVNDLRIDGSATQCESWDRSLKNIHRFPPLTEEQKKNNIYIVYIKNFISLVRLPGRLFPRRRFSSVVPDTKPTNYLSEHGSLTACCLNSLILVFLFLIQNVHLQFIYISTLETNSEIKSSVADYSTGR